MRKNRSLHECPPTLQVIVATRDKTQQLSSVIWLSTTVFILLLTVLCPVGIQAQTGRTINDPIYAGSFNGSFNYTNTVNTASGFTNAYGRSTNEVYYYFNITVHMTVTIKHCGSGVSDTYMYFLNDLGVQIASNDDWSGTGACPNTYHSYLQMNLNPGWYYVVSEGYSSNGSITTQISGTPLSNQASVGDLLSNPIEVGTKSATFTWADTRNTSSGYTNTFGNTSPDVFYRFTLSKKMDMTITHCGSGISDSYMYLLNASGTQLEYNDDYSGAGACPQTLHSQLRKTLDVGTYYIVSEGYGSNVGSITTNISGTVVQVVPPGDGFQNPIEIGTKNASFSYTDTRNTSVDYSNTYGQYAAEVFYRFTVSVPMAVTINHCNSAVSDTYLHVLNASGARIYSNDDYGGCSNTYQAMLNMMLEAGTYYIVSEGYSQNGSIITNVTGAPVVQRLSYSYDASGNRTSRQVETSTYSSLLTTRAEELRLKKDVDPSDPGHDHGKDGEGKQGNGEGDDGTAIVDLLEMPETFAVYPNPTDGTVYVKIAEGTSIATTIMLRLYDTLGRLLMQSAVDKETTTLDLRNYPAGVYMLIVDIDGKTYSTKIVKQ